MSNSDLPQSPITHEVITSLLEILATVTPPQHEEILRMVPKETALMIKDLLVQGAVNEAETGIQAGMLALLDVGLQDDGSVYIGCADVAKMVKHAVEYLIAHGKE